MRISDWSSDVCSSDLMALDVGHRLLGDAPQLTLLEDRQAPGLLGPEPDLEPAALADPVEERLEGGGEALGVGHVCAQVVERVAHLPDHPAHIVAQVVERLAGIGPTAAALDDAVELEGEVGQPLPDAIVEVAGDPRTLLELGRAHV